MTKAIRAGSDRTWDATLTIPKDPPAKLFVTARFKSGVGLTEFATEEVEVREPPPTAEEVAAKKKEPPKPGSVTGVVREAGVVRPGLKVYLMDPNAKDPAKMVIKDAITKDDGSFAFEEINPGEYMLFCENDNTKRSASPRISVSAGEVTRSDLELLLH